MIGVVGKKAIHIMDKDDREKSLQGREPVDRHRRGRSRGGRARGSGSAIPGVLAAGVIEFPNGRLVSRCIDNRIGAFVVLEALRLLARDGPRPAAAVTAVATTREEIAGHRRRRAQLGRDRSSPTSPSWSTSPTPPTTPASTSAGTATTGWAAGRCSPAGASVSEVVFELLAAAAEAEGIPYTIEAASRDTRTDAEAIFNAHRGVATALVSVPNRYMHSPNEMVALEDLDRTARLLAAFARRLNPDTDFVPR